MLLPVLMSGGRRDAPPGKPTRGPMIYRALADATLLVHLVFVLFVALGAFLVVRWPRVAWLHVPAALWGIYIELSGRICPLTPLENSFRERGGEAGYAGGFIEHYVSAWIYPDGLTRNIQIWLGVVLVVLTAALYWRAFRRPLQDNQKLH
jgi:Protein of Unknown function (DUF2784)